MRRKSFRDITRPLRTFNARLKNFFALDLPLYLRRRMPFLRHAGERVKPGEGFILYLVTILLVGALTAISIIQVTRYVSTVNNITSIRAQTTVLNSRLSGDMTQYSIDDAATTLTQLFTGSELSFITQKYYDYKLLINGEPYSSDKNNYTAGSIKIEVIEVLKASKLPPTILAKGSVTGGDAGTKLSTYIGVKYVTKTFSQDATAEIFNADNQTDAIYNVDAIAGNTISITFRQNLVDKLKIANNTITLNIVS